MCGIAGIFDLSGGFCGSIEAAVRGMGATLVHRGPDDGGVWYDAPAGIALAHRRLSIVDTSPAGHQPMISRCGRYVLSFNGEIYNHLTLRKDLCSESLSDCSGEIPGENDTGRWRGHSDTETLLAAIEAWGMEAALRKCVGMFSLALWDRKDHVLTLARDRLGEKPLYYAGVGGTLVFGSELKALRSVPGFCRDISRDALALYMRHNNVPAPWTIYQNVWKLPPGSFVCFDRQMAARSGATAPGRGSVQEYWSARDAAVAGLRNPFDGSDAEAVNELERVLGQSVAGELMSDVPLGAFLSGGMDSAMVVALMRVHSVVPVRTYTIGFEEDGYDEAQYARKVAAHLGTEHSELYVTSSQAMEVIPRLAQIYDEPFADSSQIPACLLAQLARRHVTVALSGDGGDELFGGYNRYLWGRRIARMRSRIPASVRNMFAAGIGRVSPSGWDAAFRLLRPLIPSQHRYANAGDKLHKLAGLVSAHGTEDIYLRLVSHHEQPGYLVIGAHEPETVVTNPPDWLRSLSLEQRMMYLDTVTYLPDDILVKVDRAAMGASLETRMPMLDHRVVEFAMSLPLRMKIRDGKSKWLLQQMLGRHLPLEMFDRPKAGFGIPLDSWLRGPLRPWAEALLQRARIEREGYFRADMIRRQWEEHLACTHNRAHSLWNVLMFQSWLESQGE